MTSVKLFMKQSLKTDNVLGMFSYSHILNFVFPYFKFKTVLWNFCSNCDWNLGLYRVYGGPLHKAGCRTFLYGMLLDQSLSHLYLVSRVHIAVARVSCLLVSVLWCASCFVLPWTNQKACFASDCCLSWMLLWLAEVFINLAWSLTLLPRHSPVRATVILAVLSHC